MNEFRWGDLYIGMRQRFQWAFTEEMVASFTSISGDVNPLHLDRDYAVSAGFDAPVLFGMLTSSLYSRLVGVYLPGKFGLLQGIKIDFHSPCYVEDRLTVQGEIVFLSEAYQRMEVKASILSQHGNAVSKAVIKAGLRDK